jgi:hypothetical protein
MRRAAMLVLWCLGVYFVVASLLGLAFFLIALRLSASDRLLGVLGTASQLIAAGAVVIVAILGWHEKLPGTGRARSDPPVTPAPATAAHRDDLARGPFTPMDWLLGVISDLVLFLLSLVAIDMGFARLPWLPSNAVFVFLLAMMIGLANGYSTMRLRRRKREAKCLPQGYCVKCGYNLTGNVSGICPECGEPTRSL